MVQRTGFEPAKHYALGPHPSPFDHSGTSARSERGPNFVYHDGESLIQNPNLVTGFYKSGFKHLRNPSGPTLLLIMIDPRESVSRE